MEEKKATPSSKVGIRPFNAANFVFPPLLKECLKLGKKKTTLRAHFIHACSCETMTVDTLIEQPNPNLTERSGFYFFHRGLPFCHYSFTNQFAITASRATHLCTPTIHACVVVAGLVALSTGPLEPLSISIGANLMIPMYLSLNQSNDHSKSISWVPSAITF